MKKYRWYDINGLVLSLEYILTYDYLFHRIGINWWMDNEECDTIVISIYDLQKTVKFSSEGARYSRICTFRYHRETVMYTIMNHTVYELSNLLYNKILSLNAKFISRCKNEE